MTGREQTLGRASEAAHQVHEVQGEDVDAARHGGQGADDGGEDAQPTRAEQQVLCRRGRMGYWASQSRWNRPVSLHRS